VLQSYFTLFFCRPSVAPFIWIQICLCCAFEAGDGGGFFAVSGGGCLSISEDYLGYVGALLV
jgi:hypothetical protein